VVDDYGTRSYLGPTEVIKCVSTAFGPYATPVWAPPCTDSRTLDTGTQVETVCSHPDSSNNYVDRPVGPCTEVVNSVGPNEVRTTCRKDIDGPRPVPTWACADVAQSGSGPAITCDTTTNIGELVTSCTEGSVDFNPPFATTTRCESTPTDPMRDYPGVWSTGRRAIRAKWLRAAHARSAAVASLIPPARVPTPIDPGTGIITHCEAPIPSGGRKYFVSTTTTVTTQPFSGGVPTANALEDTSSTSPVPVDDRCYEGPTCPTSRRSSPCRRRPSRRPHARLARSTRASSSRTPEAAPRTRSPTSPSTTTRPTCVPT
jgi:hypothetical protein